jgi:hypothetical protein
MFIRTGPGTELSESGPYLPKIFKIRFNAILLFIHGSFEWLFSSSFPIGPLYTLLIYLMDAAYATHTILIDSIAIIICSMQSLYSGLPNLGFPILMAIQFLETLEICASGFDSL